MPTFEYKCKKCNTIFDIKSQYFDLKKQEKDITCPICKSKEIRRVFGKFEVIYRGNGFYNTDNKKEEKSGN